MVERAKEILIDAINPQGTRYKLRLSLEEDI